MPQISVVIVRKASEKEVGMRVPTGFEMLR